MRNTLLKRAKADQGVLSGDKLLAYLRREQHPRDIETLAVRFGATPRKVMAEIRRLQDQSVMLYLLDDQWTCTSQPMESDAFDSRHAYKSRTDGTYVFGFSSDQHLCSKYSRLEILEDLYDKFAAAGVDRVFNAGNWVDGEARFNKHDLLVHGLDNQLGYMADHYPERTGLKNYTVAGDDHEGWYGQREGIDVGRHAQRVMEDHGRRDWVNLGYMESFVPLVHRKTKATAMMLLMHPGGGSAYAISYRPQKIVEGFAGGEKPAVLLIAHYHKMSYNVFRNVHCVQSGTTQDQTPFMRKKGIDAHVGGGICRLTQDAATGAIVGCSVQFYNYYVSGYYNHRWSHGGGVVLPRAARHEVLINMEIKQICLDMDGVLADFVGGTAKLLGFDPALVTTWDYYDQVGTTEEKFWAAIDSAGEDFWANLEPYPWFEDLYQECVETAPTVIMTVPSNHPSSLTGKLLWLQKHFGPKFRGYHLVGEAKEFCACEGSLLIDDSDKNCEKFRKGGGAAIVFPRPWNSERDMDGSPSWLVRSKLTRVISGEFDAWRHDADSLSADGTRTFSTGAVRSTDADGTRYDLVSPIGLRRLAETYAEGARKYSDNNWLKGFPQSTLLNHAIRHIELWRSGDATEDHLAHAAWNLFAAMHFEETRTDLMDIPARAKNLIALSGAA